MKMTKQEDKNLVQVQQQCRVYFCMKTIFKSWFFWLIWPFEYLNLMILTMAKYYGNLLRDSTLSLLFIVKFFSSLKIKMILKMPHETFLRITRYIRSFFLSLSLLVSLSLPLFLVMSSFLSDFLFNYVALMQWTIRLVRCKV